MATKKEIESINADLRQQILNLKKELADKGTHVNADRLALGLEIIDGKYCFIKVPYGLDGIPFENIKVGAKNPRSKAIFEKAAVKILYEGFLDTLPNLEMKV